nr:immunoglobulin light chain junction region [Macaca mulatta]MOX17230.1 immunoglobulin light chain junction region [Macaca mulatta]MOX17342.1 immunoglobulin light chain junction region [Macaca mulatta]MOX17536.1 immunoglobulin light chain junction region [Macaca mulatta]MOX17665.1 immunoglobulin light chain junction region [Macaca mulatta]
DYYCGSWDNSGNFPVF